MGYLKYDATDRPFEIDDRTLAHLRIVIMNKLRRNESFMMKLDNPDVGERWLWIHPSIPLQLHFYGSRGPGTNMAWIEQLMKSASSSNGLVVMPEPDPAAPAAL